MSRLQRALLVLILGLAGLVLYLASRNPQPPLLPRDEAHAGSPPGGCLTCHGPDGALPRSANHPLGPDCLRCHGRR